MALGGNDRGVRIACGTGLSIIVLIGALVATGACDPRPTPGPTRDDLQLHVLILRKNQSLCGELAQALLHSWRDLVFKDRATYYEFPESLAVGRRRDAETVQARMEYLRESLDLLRGDLDPTLVDALDELQSFHESSCKSILRRPASLGQSRKTAYHGTDGFDHAWHEYRKLLAVPADDAKRLQARLERRLTEIDEWAAERRRLALERQRRAVQERLDQDTLKWQAFLRQQEERRGREAARLRALRESRFGDKSGDAETDRSGHEDGR